MKSELKIELPEIIQYYILEVRISRKRNSNFSYIYKSESGGVILDRYYTEVSKQPRRDYRVLLYTFTRFQANHTPNTWGYTLYNKRIIGTSKAGSTNLILTGD